MISQKRNDTFSLLGVLTVCFMLAFVGCIKVGAAQTRMFDFTDSTLGWNVNNATSPTFDGTAMSFTSTATNALIVRNFKDAQLYGKDYPYFAARIRTVNNVNSEALLSKVYVQYVDEDGKALNNVWSNGAPAQKMSYSDNGKYVTYLLNLSELDGYSTAKIGTFVNGMGMYVKGIDISVDYVAFVSESDLYQTVSFDKNTEDAVTGMPESAQVTFGGSYIVSDACPVRDEYVFLGWATEPTGEVTGRIDDIRQAITLYAVWKKDERVTITYDSNAFGDTVYGMPRERMQSCQAGDVFVPCAEIPERNGLVFAGWSTTKDGRNRIDGNFAPTEATTLYAAWRLPSCDWDFGDGNDHGWVLSGAEKNTEQGCLLMTATGSDPKMGITGLSVSPNISTKLHVLAEITLPEGISTDSFQLFVGIDGKALGEERSIRTPITAQDGKKEYVFDLSKQAFWINASLCTYLRLDPGSHSGAVIRFYRVWLETADTVAAFLPARAEGTMVCLAQKEGTLTMPTCSFIRDGYTFDGWTDGETAYADGETVTLAESTLFYPLWKSLGGFAAVQSRYPGYTDKAMIFSYDDGVLAADKKIIEIFNREGMKASFNLIAKNYDGLTEEQKENLRNVYAGHEIGNHTYSHPDMRTSVNNPLTAEQCLAEINRGKEILEDTFQTTVTGLAWPYTNPRRPETTALADKDYLYARTAPVTGGGELFAVPESFGPSWEFTCIDYFSGVVYSDSYIDLYAGLESEELTLLSVWGHPASIYSANRWDVVEKAVQLYRLQNIWNPTVSEYVTYIRALRRLVHRTDLLYNPSDVDLYLLLDGRELLLPAHSYLTPDVQTPCTDRFSVTDGVCRLCFAAEPDGTEMPVKAIAAAYDENDRLISTRLLTLDAESAQVYAVDFPVERTVKRCRIFFFADAESFKPLRMPRTVEES